MERKKENWFAEDVIVKKENPKDAQNKTIKTSKND